MNYPAIEKTGKEPEYKETPNSPISSVGTDYTTANQTNLPFGSALLTDTLDGSGNGSSILNSKGITHIIHAAPKPRNSFSSDQDFINNVVKSVQNSIILADRNNFEELSIPLVGGEIFAGSCPKDKIAEGIIRGAVNQLEKCQKLGSICLIDWEGNSQHYFLEKILQLENELFMTGQTAFFKKDNHFVGSIKNIKSKGISVRVGDIRNKGLHKSDVIVNAANTYVGFGGGISGAIGSETGNSAAIDQKAQELIGEFYSLIQKENGGGDNKYTCVNCGNIFDKTAKPSVDGKCLECKSKESGENRYTCDKCGKQFTDNPTVKDDKKYCVNCKDKVDGDNGNNKNTKICTNCGKNISGFSITKNGKDYCSQACIEKKGNDGTKLTCPKCGNQFDKLPIVKDGTSYCSKKCSGEEKTGNEKKDNKTASEWQTELKAVDNEVGQIFSEDKVKEWKEKGKGSFGRVENVKKLIESVKDNDKFLNLIKTEQNSNSLANFFANKTPQQVITIIKRFEYNNLSPSDKENKNKKIKAYYQKINQLAKNGKLTEEQINNYLYKQAIGEINGSSIQEEKSGQKAVKPSKNNSLQIAVIVGIVFLFLAIIFFLVLFSKKKKKKLIIISILSSMLLLVGAFFGKR